MVNEEISGLLQPAIMDNYTIIPYVVIIGVAAGVAIIAGVLLRFKKKKPPA